MNIKFIMDIKNVSNIDFKGITFTAMHLKFKIHDYYRFIY